MSVVRGFLGKVARRLMPETMATLQQAGTVRRELEELRARVDELQAEIDESRRDSLRVAELTDIVMTRLSRSDGSEPQAPTQ